MPLDREVFSHAPLAMVVAEIQFTYVPELDSDASLAAALDGVRTLTPLMTPGRMSLTVEVQVGTEPTSTTQQTTPVMHAKSQDGRTTVALAPQTLTVAMSGVAYTHYEDSLGPLVIAAYRSLINAVPDVFVTRLGLRYLDEVRVPDPPADVSGWATWIDPGLLGGADLMTPLHGQAAGMRATWQYALPGSRQVVLNYGPFRGSGVVGPGHPFHKEGPDDLMFVLDVDSAWTPNGGPATLTGEDLVSRYDELHRPAQAVFATAVTDQARKLFRGEQE